jgi:hypothetical protein
LVGRIHGFEYARKSLFRFRVCVGVVGESGNRPWAKGHVGRLLSLRSTRHLDWKDVGGVVGLVLLWE